jgi:hypothetical protein
MPISIIRFEKLSFTPGLDVDQSNDFGWFEITSTSLADALEIACINYLVVLS